MKEENTLYERFETAISRAHIQHLLKATHIIASLRERTHYANTQDSQVNGILAAEWCRTMEHTIQYLSTPPGTATDKEDDSLVCAFHQLILLEELEQELGR